jgi:hypothetical protein
MSNYKRKKENRQTLNKGGRTVGEDLLFRSRERHFKKLDALIQERKNPKPSKS